MSEEFGSKIDLTKLKYKIVEGELYYSSESLLEWFKNTISSYDQLATGVIAESVNVKAHEWSDALFKSGRLADAGNVVQGIALALKLFGDEALAQNLNKMFEGDN